MDRFTTAKFELDYICLIAQMNIGKQICETDAYVNVKRYLSHGKGWGIINNDIKLFLFSHLYMFQVSSKSCNASILYEKNREYLLQTEHIFVPRIQSVGTDLFCIDRNSCILVNNERFIICHNVCFWLYDLLFRDLSLSENIICKDRVSAHFFKFQLVKDYSDILQLLENTERDQSILIKIQAFQSKYKVSEKIEYLYAKYYFNLREYSIARQYLKKGLQKRRFNPKMNEMMGDIETFECNYKLAIQYYSYALISYATPSQTWMLRKDGSLICSKELQGKIIYCLEQAKKIGANILAACMEEMTQRLIVPRAKFSQKKLLYKDGSFFAVDSDSLEINTYSGTYFKGGYQGFCDSFLLAKRYKEYSYLTNKKVLLPIMRFSDGSLEVQYDGRKINYGKDNNVNRMREKEWVSLYIDKNISIKSNASFAVGTPVAITRKKRVVFNIFIDGLSFSRIKENFAEIMPYTCQFFSKGVVFSEAYAAAEWTNPSYTSMFWGKTQKCLNTFHPRFNMQLPKGESISSRLTGKGYHSICFTDLGERLIVASEGFSRYYSKIALPLEYAINQSLQMIEKYSIPFFFNIHTMEVHDSSIWPSAANTSTLDISCKNYDRIMLNDMFGNSYAINNNEITRAREETYLYSIKEVDRKLKFLYEYIEKNYKEDEYFIVLHSDHGGYGGKFLISREHSNIALMARGKNIPVLGIQDEMVEAIDMYSIYEKYCGLKCKHYIDGRLPECLGGGLKRDYAITSSMYPGQSYKVAISDKNYEFWMETSAKTTFDGRVDLDDFNYYLFDRRNDYKEIHDEKIANKYISIACNYSAELNEPDM